MDGGLGLQPGSRIVLEVEPRSAAADPNVPFGERDTRK
jgi:hypothetical protein